MCDGVCPVFNSANIVLYVANCQYLKSLNIVSVLLLMQERQERQ